MGKSLSAATLLVLILTPIPAAQAPKVQPLAGWFGVFPQLGTGYIRTFKQPQVDPKTKTRYSQMVIFEWSGGAAKRLEVTLARDPAFEKKYAAGAVMKEDNPPKKVEVSQRPAWLWQMAKDKKPDAMPLHARLVIPLGADRILLLEAKGVGPWEDVVKLASRFDLKKIVAALDTPPRTDFSRNAAAFKVLRKGMSYAEIASWVGFADRDIGKGIHIMVYDLEGGQRVLLGFADFNRLLYARLETKNGKVEELAK